LVFDVPKHARGIQGGVLDGEREEDGGQPRQTESLFEIRCKVEVKLGMGIGRSVQIKISSLKWVLDAGYVFFK
jgi:hypothetical protein